MTATSTLASDTAALILNDLEQRRVLYGGQDADAPPESSRIAWTVETIEAVATGDDTVMPHEDVREHVQTVCEALFSNPLLAEYQIPDAFWRTDLGRVCASALAVTSGADLVTIADAARESGIPLGTLHARVKAGSLRTVTIWDKARGRPRRMLYRADIA